LAHHPYREPETPQQSNMRLQCWMHTIMIAYSFTFDFEHSENLRKKMLNLEFDIVTCVLKLFSFYKSRMKNLHSSVFYHIKPQINHTKLNSENCKVLDTTTI
jgi:hypothetical protein